MGKDGGDGQGDGIIRLPESFFAKQIVVQPDYVLSVNPGSVREDAGETNVTVRASVGNGEPVDGDKYVILSLGSTTGLNSRFRITLPTLRIADGETVGSGTIVFTPLEDEDSITDLPITIVGSAGSNEIVGSTEINLVDTDKSK